MALVMCSVTDKSMPVMLAVLLPQKMAKCARFPKLCQKCSSTIDKSLGGVMIDAYISVQRERRGRPVLSYVRETNFY